MNDASLIASSRFTLSSGNYIDLTKLSSLMPGTSVPSRFNQVLDESSAALDRVGSAAGQSNNVAINEGYSGSSRNAVAQSSSENSRFNASENTGLDTSEPARFSKVDRKDSDYNLSPVGKGGKDLPVSSQEDKPQQALSGKANAEKESDAKLDKNSAKKAISEANKKKNKDSDSPDSSANGNAMGIVPGAAPLVAEQIKREKAGLKRVSNKNEVASLSKPQAGEKVLQGQTGVKSAHELASQALVDKKGEVGIAQKGNKKKLFIDEALQGQKNTDASLDPALNKKPGAHAVVNVTSTPQANSKTLYKPFKNANQNIKTSSELNIKKGVKQINAADLLKKTGKAKNGEQGVSNTQLSKVDASSNNNTQNTLNKDGGSLLKGYATSVSTPVGQPGWDDGLSNKVVWLTKQNFKLAEIHLNPAELGPVGIKIKMDKDHQANITFNSPNADIRTLLENTLPRLRDMLSQNGISLGHTDVSSQQNFQGQTSQDSGTGYRGSNTSSNTGLSGSEELRHISTISQIMMDRAVDYYV